MAAIRGASDPNQKRRPPATTPEARENQLVSAAIDLAEKQIREGTASSQVITHFLKLATQREKLEMEKLTRENALLAARTENMGSTEDLEKLYKDALGAMRTYSGQETGDDDDED